MRTLTTLAAAFVLATAAFTITILTKPPISEARAPSPINTYALTLAADLPEAPSYDQH